MFWRSEGFGNPVVVRFDPLVTFSFHAAVPFLPESPVGGHVAVFARPSLGGLLFWSELDTFGALD